MFVGSFICLVFLEFLYVLCVCQYYTYAFYYLAPLQNDSIMTSQCMQFSFGDKREVYLLGESALPVTEKENMQEGKMIQPPTIVIKYLL